MKPRPKIQRVSKSPVKNSYQWDLAKLAFGSNEEPRGNKKK